MFYYAVLLRRLQDSLHGLEHTTVLNKVEVLFNEGIETLHLVKVFLPDEVSCQHTVCNLLCVVCCPQLLQELDNLRVIVRCDLGTIGAFATFIISNDGSKSEDESLRQFALALEIGLHAGEVASLELGE